MPRRRSTARPPAPLDREGLERAAFRYLERFDSSAQNLRRVLGERARRAASDADEAERAQRIVDELIERYQSSGLIDDARYAEALARGLRARGSSRRAIVEKLRAKGVERAVIEGALERAERDATDAELEAARAFVRRRRLGPHRPAEERAARRMRDLGALARAGFGPDTARRALADPEDDAL
jgi:regulatory protein